MLAREDEEVMYVMLILYRTFHARATTRQVRVHVCEVGLVEFCVSCVEHDMRHNAHIAHARLGFTSTYTAIPDQ